MQYTKKPTATHHEFAVEVIVFTFGSFLSLEILKKTIGALFSTISSTLVVGGTLFSGLLYVLTISCNCAEC